MQSGLNTVSMPVGAMEYALYFSIRKIRPSINPELMIRMMLIGYCLKRVFQQNGLGSGHCHLIIA